MRRLVPIAILAALASGTLPHAQGDPALAAFQSLQTINPGPVQGSTSSGALRFLTFDIAASGRTPADQARAFLLAYGAAFGLTGPNQGVVLRSSGVGLMPGQTNALILVMFTETYRGLPVFGGGIKVGITPGSLAGGSRVVSAGGAILPDLDLEGGLDTEATIAPGACVAAARTYLGRPGASALADPKRMIYDARLFEGAPGAHLVWALTLDGGDPRQVLCDAHTGAVVFARPFAESSLDLDLVRMNNQFPFNNVALGDENGLNPTGQADSEAWATWWDIKVVYDTIASVFGWRGTQGNDNGLQVVIGSSNTTNAMFWNNIFGENIQLANGWTSFDVLGHEYTHGIIHHTSDLVYANVPGALNEGYADAIGTWLDPGDWLLGEDRIGFPGVAVRNFQYPYKSGQPEKLSGLAGLNNNPDTPNDFGSVHFNSGILNKAHYLMASGDGFNGRPGFLTVAMGRNRMGILAFFTMKSLPASANFSDARAWSIFVAKMAAANNLFGFVPSDVCAVKDAFAAVEVGPGDFDCDGIDDNFQDPDKDFIPSSKDNCPNNWNPNQADWDHDGKGDVCDVDFDNDGIPDAKDNCKFAPNWNQLDTDGDGLGDVCDPDDDNDGWSDASDNCPGKYNPSQVDGNGNGAGDACDPDTDGDGIYDSTGDNCTFVYNPTQADSDGDNLGDACDLCPLVNDWTGAYLVQKWISTTPVPYQPDSDGDGIPDACDPDAFGSASLDLNGLPYNPGHMFHPGSGESSFGRVAGPVGSRIRLPVPVCDASTQPGPISITEIAFGDLDPAVGVTLLDDDGLGIGAIRPGPSGPAGSNQRGIRVTPDCSRTYYLEFAFGPGFSGVDDFTVGSSFVDETTPNPWVTPGGGDPPPPPIPDLDGDGIPDVSDTCPAVFDPTGADTDADGFGDVCDDCPADFNPQQIDADADGRGDVCDCAPSDGTAFSIPDEVSGLDVSDSLSGGGIVISFANQAPTHGSGTRYDVFSGSVSPLRTSGSFASGMCYLDNLPSPSFVYAQPGPIQGQAIYFMIRAQNTCPGGTGTYGTSNRDATSAQSPGACP